MVDLTRLVAVLAAPGVVFGVIAIFAAVGKVHWFWRAAVLLAACGLLVFTHAGDPMLFGLIAGGEVFLTIAVARLLMAWWKRRGEPHGERRPVVRFGIRELLAATATVAAVVVLASWAVGYAPFMVWWPLVGAASIYAAMLLSTVAAVEGLFRWRWPARIGVVVAYLVCVAAAGVGWEHLDWFGGGTWYGTTFIAKVPRMILAVQAFTLLLVLVLWRLANLPPPQGVPARRYVAIASKLALVLTFAPVLATAGWLYWQFLAPTLPAPPRPAHADVVAEIADTLANQTALTVPDVDDATNDELAKFAFVYGGVLDRFSQSLTQPCCTHLDYSLEVWTIAGANKSMARIDMSRKAGRMFQARAEMHERAGQFEQAAQEHLNTVRLGVCAGRGGTAADALVGEAIETIGYVGLHSIRSDLSALSLRQAAAEIEEIDAQRESLETILARERHYYLHALGWHQRMFEICEMLIGDEDFDVIYQASWNRRAAESRMLTAELAIDAFEQEQGAYPSSLAELVPEYLQRVPLDPYGDGPLKYRRDEDAYVLYSIGKNGIDDGGERVEWEEVIDGEVGDYFLDVRYEE